MKICKAIKKNGLSCTNATKPNSDYCGVHASNQKVIPKDYKNVTCHQIISNNPQESKKLVAQSSTHQECTNRKTISGYDVNQYSDLFKIKTKSGQTFCFYPPQTHFLNGKNPYSVDDPLPQSDLAFVPPISILADDLCPLEPISSDPMKVILNAKKPVHSLQDLPKNIPIEKYTDKPSYSAYSVHLKIKPVYIESDYLYVLTLKKKLGKYSLSKKEIESIHPFISKSYVKQGHIKINDPEILDILQKWFNYLITSFEEPMIAKIRKLNLHLDHPVKAFRGLLIHGKEKIVTKGWSDLSIGQDLDIESVYPTSWSTDSCISLYFTTGDPALRVDYSIRLCFGILVSGIISPQDVLLDSRVIDPDQKKNLIYTRNQHELIVLPSVQKCRVERLYVVDIKEKIYLPVKTFATIFDHIS